MNRPSRAIAHLNRMVTPEHICPWGLKSRWLLRRKAFVVDDHWLKSRQQTDEFKREQGVETTPQTFIGGERVGGYDELRRYFGMSVHDPKATSYRPVVAVFCMAALLALAVTLGLGAEVVNLQTVERFIAMSMCILALLKLQDVESFSSMFLNYDLLARRAVPYAYVYPFAEALAGLTMVSGRMLWLGIPVAGFIGSVGAWD